MWTDDPTTSFGDFASLYIWRKSADIRRQTRTVGAFAKRGGGVIGVIVMTHGQFGQELLRTAQDIVGRQESIAAFAVTPEMGPETVSQELQHVLDRLSTADGALIMVDMLGGTPCNTALLKTKHVPAEVLTGVNLYMILSSFTHRNEMDLKSLAAKVAEDGRRAIVSANDLLMKRLS